MNQKEVELLLLAIAVLVSIFSAMHARRSARLSLHISKRQHVIDLHNIWLEVTDFDIDDPGDIGMAYKAAYAMNLTAACMKHEIIDKEIIKEIFSERFKEVYDKLNTVSYIPDSTKEYKTLISENTKKYIGG
ncbi:MULTISPECIES: hypothetical protein [unclassified Cobetia]|uniref:hypothetical protein n=1 Tax=unclassified Cobetia TaxID=2609414 RepID=UPI00178CB33F|nr:MULTISPECIES: hypothetical protein [unclassified Cobetia]MBE2169213.1 hypothetical protein [Cobetia sp. 2AS1]MDH2446701.1 hypothetical protein [Cobetia sp. 2AS]